MVIRRGLGWCHSGFEACKNTVIVSLVATCWIRAHGNEDIGYHEKPKSGRHNSNDRTGLVIEQDRFANDRRLGPESSPPQSITENHEVSSRVNPRPIAGLISSTRKKSGGSSVLAEGEPQIVHGSLSVVSCFSSRIPPSAFRV